MGFGINMAFIAIGAILAFAVHADIRGLNINVVGWILMAVGVFGMFMTFTYIRPRRRGRTTEIIEEPGEPMMYNDGDLDDVQPQVHIYRDPTRRDRRADGE